MKVMNDESCQCIHLQHTQSTHPINTPYQHTQSTHHINTPYHPPFMNLSTGASIVTFIDTPLSTHPINTLSPTLHQPLYRCKYCHVYRE